MLQSVDKSYERQSKHGKAWDEDMATLTIHPGPNLVLVKQKEIGFSIFGQLVKGGVPMPNSGVFFQQRRDALERRMVPANQELKPFMRCAASAIGGKLRRPP